MMKQHFRKREHFAKQNHRKDTQQILIENLYLDGKM